MPTILVFDHEPADAELIRRITPDRDYTVLAARTIEDFQLQMTGQFVDLAIVSLAAIAEQDTARLQAILHQAPDTKVFAMAPVQQGAGLATLLKAESLGARRLLSKPVDSEQVLAILDVTFPRPACQE
jgi:CheY-like chemotaxis protein